MNTTAIGQPNVVAIVFFVIFIAACGVAKPQHSPVPIPAPAQVSLSHLGTPTVRGIIVRRILGERQWTDTTGLNRS